MMYINHTPFNANDLITISNAVAGGVPFQYPSSSVINAVAFQQHQQQQQQQQQYKLAGGSSSPYYAFAYNNGALNRSSAIGQQSTYLAAANPNPQQQPQQQQQPTRSSSSSSSTSSSPSTTSSSSSSSSSSSTSCTSSSSSSALPLITTIPSTMQSQLPKNVQASCNIYPYLNTQPTMPQMVLGGSAQTQSLLSQYAKSVLGSPKAGGAKTVSVSPSAANPMQLNSFSQSCGGLTLLDAATRPKENGAIDFLAAKNASSLNQLQFTTANLATQSTLRPKYYTSPQFSAGADAAYFFANASQPALTSTGSLAGTTTYLTASPFGTDLSFASATGLSSKPIVQTSSFAAKTIYNATVGAAGIKKRKRRYKKPIELRKVLPKNSLMLLHELRPNVEYRFVSQSGPIHRPVFTMCVDINEHKFEGVGKTKKEARMMSAEKAVQFLLSHPEYIQKPKPKDTSSTGSCASLSSGENKAVKTGDEEEEDAEEEDDDEIDGMMHADLEEAACEDVAPDAKSEEEPTPRESDNQQVKEESS